MGGRTLPTECEHGRIVDGGDFMESETCRFCEAKYAMTHHCNYPDCNCPIDKIDRCLLGLPEESVHITIRPAEEKAVAVAQFVDNLEWSDTLLDGKTVDYKAALAAVEALGEGWRLPTRFELESLLDLSRHDPAIDTEKFPDTKSTWYWTDTECAWNDAAVWVVGFSGGSVSYDGRRNGGACARAVRAGQ